jgi:hypothetical protein
MLADYEDACGDCLDFGEDVQTIGFQSSANLDG